MLQLQNISKIFPHGEPLLDVSFELTTASRIGLVGANGSGKTTLFRIITGEVEASSGQITRQPGLRIAYLTQEFDVRLHHTVHDELRRAFAVVNDIHDQLMSTQHMLETAGANEIDSLLKRLDRLQRQFEQNGGYDVDRKIEKLLPTIGFKPEDGDRLVSTFSGGWQMRMAFGKLMLQEPDIILLDEPTNHIDLETIEWLECYLKQLTAAMIIVSHDRMFLDRLCTRIIELERGSITEYQGNYSTYVAAKQIAKETQQAAFERQEREIERQQQFVDRFRASATRSTQAKSREHQLEKMELIEEPESDIRTLKFRFPPCQRSGREVARVKELMHGYGDNILFCDADLLIERGDKVALLGPNGSGKSTLLRLLSGNEQPLSGEVRHGEHGIVPAYFEQNQAEALDLQKTVLQTIADELDDWKDSQIRGLLGRFLFSGDTVFKQVGMLSGGEKARLALAKLLLRSANFLLLDEPTNHLDIPAKEMLEEALKEYEGAAVIVSHDRYFISQVATVIVELTDSGLRSFAGNYDYYQQKMEEERLAREQARQEAERQAQLAEKRAKQKEKERLRKEKSKVDRSR
jgi:ATP-binding cassette subfamily F protein 3